MQGASGPKKFPHSKSLTVVQITLLSNITMWTALQQWLVRLCTALYIIDVSIRDGAGKVVRQSAQPHLHRL